MRLEDIGEYVAWLRLPPTGRDGWVAVLPSVAPHVVASTINRKLSALAAFYVHQVRHGVDVGELLITWQSPGRRGGWKPFLHHISKDTPRLACRRCVLGSVARAAARGCGRPCGTCAGGPPCAG